MEQSAQFGEFKFDSASRTLLRNGRPVKIQPQPLRVLGILLARPGEVITRDELRQAIWGDTTFVEFDQGLNYSIRQIRLALHDEAARPMFIETLPKQGYRFIAQIESPPPVSVPKPPPTLPAREELPNARSTGRRWWMVLTAALVVLLSAVAAYLFRARQHSLSLKYTQLTDFKDSAIGAALSPDGRLLAFFAGNSLFFTADPIYIKMLPEGPVKRLVDDPRIKYGLAFSPDGSQLAYTAIEGKGFSTYTVPVLGGDPQLFLTNAAGLTWLDEHRILFSQIRTGVHLGLVSGTLARQAVRDIYFPAHERRMAHYSFASPDRKKALVVEMTEIGGWGTCRLVALDNSFPPRTIGPDGACTAAAWSSDGTWMYFSAYVSSPSHLWRQHFPDGRPEQLTFGPTEEIGVVPEKNSRSIITSIGDSSDTLWMHDPQGDRALVSEGQIESDWCRPRFSADGENLYYLLRMHRSIPEPELWRSNLQSRTSGPVFPSVHLNEFAIDHDNRHALYTTNREDGRTALWSAAIDGSSPPKLIGEPGDHSPKFGARGDVLFEFTEGSSNYLGHMNPEGSSRAKLVPYPISSIGEVSPQGRWVTALIPLPDGTRAPVAIPTAGGPASIICSSYCETQWSLDGSSLIVSVENASTTSPGRSWVVPLGPDENLSAVPANGITAKTQQTDIPGSRLLLRANFIAGKDLAHFAYVKSTSHFNLFRIELR